MMSLVKFSKILGVTATALPSYARTTGLKDLREVIRTSLNIMIFIVIIAAVIYLIINGLKFVTSQGDSSKAQEAQKGITFAIIGIVVAVAASLIVNFVIKKLMPETETI